MTFEPYVPVGNHPVTDLSIRVQNLEAALAVSVKLLQSLAEKLESRLGPGFLGEELEQFTAIGCQAAEQVAEIDRLVKENQQPAAARVIREMSGVTWDQAHYITNRWTSLQSSQKARWLQLNQLAHTTRPVAPEPE